MAKKKKKRKTKEIEPTGIEAIDRLAGLPQCRIADYVAAVSAYVRDSADLAPGPKKAAQIRLSNGLARAFEADLKEHLPNITVHVGEKKVSGALRTVNADVSEMHELDGLRLAVELKPVNLAVGRAIWNRFGDLRTFAVNLHLKFPFAVIGGVLVVPIYEQTNTKEALEAAASELEEAEEVEESADEDAEGNAVQPALPPGTKSTRHLIERAVQRLIRAGGRKTEGDAPHLLEAIAVVAYDPQRCVVAHDLPAEGTGLRWEEFIKAIALAYKGRFEV